MALTFLGIILAGTFLLSLPAASRSGRSAGFLTSLFTAASATCVTGLVMGDTYTMWTPFGQGMILLMIQIGGLGFMSAASLAYFTLILGLHRCGVDWMGMAAPYPFLNYTAPAGWFGWLPDTAGPATMGVGVAYALILMLGVFLLVGQGLLAAAKKIKQARP